MSKWLFGFSHTNNKKKTAEKWKKYRCANFALKFGQLRNCFIYKIKILKG